MNVQISLFMMFLAFRRQIISFLMRKAEIRISQGNVLMPYVKMGVEAREQVMGSTGSTTIAGLMGPKSCLIRHTRIYLVFLCELINHALNLDECFIS